MKRALLIVAVVLAARSAAARPARPGDDGVQRAIAVAVEARVRASLPATLGLVQLRVPASFAATPETIAIAWPSAPRAGWVNVQLQAGATSAWAQAELAPVGEVVVAARALVAGERLDASAIGTERRVVTAESVTLPPPALDGAVVARPVAAGAPLSRADVVLPAPIAQGAPVEVRLQRGTLVVSARGVLERSAHPGEATSARLSDGGQLVHGRLADAHTLILEVTP